VAMGQIARSTEHIFPVFNMKSPQALSADFHKTLPHERKQV